MANIVAKLVIRVMVNIAAKIVMRVMANIITKIMIRVMAKKLNTDLSTYESRQPGEGVVVVSLDNSDVFVKLATFPIFQHPQQLSGHKLYNNKKL